MAKKDNEIRVRGVSPELVIELNNIAEHLDISVTDMLKPELRKFSLTYSKDIRNGSFKKEKK